MTKETAQNFMRFLKIERFSVDLLDCRKLFYSGGGADGGGGGGGGGGRRGGAE